MSPPTVIPIDVGRQLFVDDFLIDETDLDRVYHAAEYYRGNPILEPNRPWEQELTRTGASPAAMPFSDGVWYDPADRLFKMWYMGGYVLSTCYATSEDGLHWDKPSLDVVPGTNIVNSRRRDSALIWLDLEESDPARRYKMYINDDAGGFTNIGSLHFSQDGIHWGEAVARTTNANSDRNSFFRNLFRGNWVFSIKAGAEGVGRCRRYRECASFVGGFTWTQDELVPWTSADRLDPQREELGVQPQIYNLDAVAYESIMLGLFTIWRGQTTERPKPNDIVLGHSRDGFHWYRPECKAFIPVSE